VVSLPEDLGTPLLRRLEIAGNPYIGVFCAANDELLIAAPDVPKSAIRHIGGALETSPIVTSVGHSTVVGSLLALNSKGILASPFIEEAELDAIGDAVYPLPHRLSAVGNNDALHELIDDLCLALLRRGPVEADVAGDQAERRARLGERVE